MKNLLLLSLLAFTLSFSAFAAKKGLSINVPLSPAGSFKIESKKIKGKVVNSGGTYKAKELYVKVKDLDSGMDLRDEHLKNKDRLDEKKHPKIVVKNVIGKGGKGQAIIIIKKVKKKIRFTYSIDGKLFVAKFKLNTKDFPLKKLSYLGVGVKGVIQVTARVPIAK